MFLPEIKKSRDDQSQKAFHPLLLKWRGFHGLKPRQGNIIGVLGVEHKEVRVKPAVLLDYSLVCLRLA